MIRGYSSCIYYCVVQSFCFQGDDHNSTVFLENNIEFVSTSTIVPVWGTHTLNIIWYIFKKFKICFFLKKFIFFCSMSWILCPLRLFYLSLIHSLPFPTHCPGRIRFRILEFDLWAVLASFLPGFFLFFFSCCRTDNIFTGVWLVRKGIFLSLQRYHEGWNFFFIL